MESNISINSEKPRQLKQVLEKSLESEGDIEHNLSKDKDKVKINTQTKTIGQLRGCTDTVFRLGTLSKKILER